MLDRYDYTAGLPGYDAALSNKPRREHNKECREKIEAQMHDDPEDLVRIIARDIRLERPNRETSGRQKGSPDSVEEGQQPDLAEQPADQQGVDARERRRGKSDLWSRRRPSCNTHSVVKFRNSSRMTPADKEVTDTKRRRLLGMEQDVKTILRKLGLKSCHGVGQKLTKMIANMTEEQDQNKVKTLDVFRKMGVYKKVDRGEVKKKRKDREHEVGRHGQGPRRLQIETG